MSIVIVGAGCAGLAAYHRLRREGYNFALLEAREFVGGSSYSIFMNGQGKIDFQ